MGSACATHVIVTSKNMSYKTRPYTKYTKKAKRNPDGKMVTMYVPKRNRKSMLNQVETGKGPERKSVENNSTYSLPLTSSFASPVLLNGIAQGYNVSERVGRKVIMKSLLLRYIASPAANGVSQNRIVVVYDKQANGSAPISTDVFQSNTTLSPLNLSNSDRFVVLCDFWTDPSQSSALNMAGTKYVKMNLEEIFGGVGATVSSINSGSVYCFIGNNSDPTIGQTSTSYLFSRIRYIDN